MNEFVLPPLRRLTLKERRRLAEMEVARCNWHMEVGLQLAHRLKEYDAEMRWLAELFPLEELSDPVEARNAVADRRLSEWCAAHPEDARALRYLADARGDQVLMEKAAAMGDARALGKICFSSNCYERRFQLARAAAEQGDAEGAVSLSLCFRHGIGCEKSEKLAKELMERAAILGNYVAYVAFVVTCMQKGGEQRLEHLIAFFGMSHVSSFSSELYSDLEAVFQATDGFRVIYKVGEALKGIIDVEGEQKQLSDYNCRRLLQAVKMYDGWCDLAREACVAWVLIAKRFGFGKDVRRIIAKMVWEARGENLRDISFPRDRPKRKCCLM